MSIQTKPSRIDSSLLSELKHVPASEGTSLAHFPDFLILGPQRTGSTWLFHHLHGHPDLFLPWEKEVYYFNALEEGENRSGLRTLEDYLGRMKDSPVRSVRKQMRSIFKHGALYHPKLYGEATASYATLPPEMIREILLLNPVLRGFLFLRDPIERAWSHARKDLIDRHSKPVDEIPDDDFARFFRTAGQKKKSQYREMIDQWSSQLLEGHLLVGDFNAIRSQPVEILRAALRFLGVRSEDRFLNLETLDRPVNPASSIPIPQRVRDLLKELQADEIADFESTRTELEPHAWAPGCWRL